MYGELEPYEGENRLDRRARRETERLRRSENTYRAGLESVENVAAYEVSLRLLNGAQLVAQGQTHLTTISTYTDRVAKDKPGLEMQHRELADTYAIGASQLIYGYMNRRRRYS
jgi:hypothetical protein